MIQKITQADKELFISLTAKFYKTDAVLHDIPMEYHERAFDEAIRSDEYISIYILSSDGNGAGYALTSKHYSHESGGIILWIEELYIQPQYRGCGLGSEFFRYIESNADSMVSGYHMISGYRLECEHENEGAMKLYKRLGYTELPYVQLVK